MGESVEKKQFTDPQDLLNKIDYEGPEGITWFGGAEFEDDELAQLVDDANMYWNDFYEAINSIEERVAQLNEANTNT